MTYEEDLQKTICIYWWNMGEKTLDYVGTYEGYFKKRGFRVARFRHPEQKDVFGVRVKLSTSSSIVRLVSFGSNVDCFDDVIKLYLTLMGDKAVLENGYGREYNINYR